MKRVLFLLAISVFFVLISCQQQTTYTPVALERTYENLGPEASYVGIEVCKECHVLEYENFMMTAMGRSFKRAALSKSSARWDDQEPVYDPFYDIYYQPFHRGEDLFIMEYRLSENGDTLHRRVEQIDYIVGSGSHTNSHIMEENGYLTQMPMTYYTQDGKWGVPPKFNTGNNLRFSRPISLECMSCHNGITEHVPNSENKFTKVVEGIDCERCHGPGSVHVNAMNTGRIVDVTKEIDYTIVTPIKTPFEINYDICRNCHMQGAAVYREGKRALDFRPGMRLADVQNVYWPRFPDSTKNFLMASHPDRLMMSECFKQSHDEERGYKPMTCIDCHNPHLNPDSVNVDMYREICLDCHSAIRDVRCTESQAVRAENGDDCYACHMPESLTMDIPNVRITDHYIRKLDPYAPTEDIPTDKTFIRMASLIDDQPSLRDFGDGFLAYYEELTNHPGFLDSAAVFFRRAEEEEGVSRQEIIGSLIRMWFLRQEFLDEDFQPTIDFANSVDEYMIRDPWTLYRIGEAFAKTENPERAVHYFSLAVNLAPEHLRFLNKLAAAYSANQQLDRAVELYNTIMEKNPKFQGPYNNRGFTKLMMRDFAGAEADFKRALVLNPDAVEALANLASLYYNSNRRAAARPLVDQLLRLYPDNPEYLRFAELLE